MAAESDPGAGRRQTHRDPLRQLADDNDTVLQLVVVDLAEYRSNEDDRRLMAAVGIRERAKFRIYVHSGGACKRSRMTTNA